MHINDEDAVIVLKPDGTFESSIPEFDDNDIPDHIVISAAIVHALQNPELLDIIEQSFLQECREMPKDLKNNKTNTKASKSANVINIWDKIKIQ